MLPHERESFVNQCCEWYREAVKQMLKRIDLSDPVLLALKDIEVSAILNERSSRDTVVTLARNILCITAEPNLQMLDRQRLSLIIDSDIKNGGCGWQKYNVTEFWRAIQKIEGYKELGYFMAQIIALSQSTAAVERTFSKSNNNKSS